MPAEWEPHEATWIAWPHEPTDWPGKFEAIPWVYGEVVRHLSRVEKVRILVAGDEMQDRSRRVLTECGAALDNIEYFHLPTNRSWTRDYCPIFVGRPGEVAVTNWIFNGWAKYDNWEADNAVPAALAQRLGMTQFETGIVLEGGSIDVNGAGALLTTEECLLSPVQARNPSLAREQIERALGDYLDVGRVLWLRNGIAGDDTHGHIDDLARFVNAETIVTVIEEDPYEVNFEPTQENVAILRAFGGYRVVTLPTPEPVYFAGQRLPASYANFYIANGTVLVPTFNDRNDRVALNILSEMFPDRTVVGIACTDLVLGLGALHCMTQQQPQCE
jgi:agmatine deiminase